ncbi:cobalamin biosynthesis protein [Nocardia asteroides]|uniref:cobalamin biosynthesis protein n=1 Tax=Nocardia asteroides TaxID=1824 RepID=UPI0036489BE1
MTERVDDSDATAAIRQIRDKNAATPPPASTPPPATSPPPIDDPASDSPVAAERVADSRASSSAIGAPCLDPAATAAGRDRVRVVVGLGLRPGTDAETIARAIDAVVGAAVVTVTGLATIDRRAAEAGLLSAAKRLGVPVIACRAEELAQVDTPHRSPRVVRAVGTPSVAEAAALLVGRGELVCGRTVVGGVVVAVATVAGDRN